MLSEDALILSAVVGACVLLILGILELIWTHAPTTAMRISASSLSIRRRPGDARRSSGTRRGRRRGPAGPPRRLSRGPCPSASPRRTRSAWPHGPACPGRKGAAAGGAGRREAP